MGIGYRFWIIWIKLDKMEIGIIRWKRIQMDEFVFMDMDGVDLVRQNGYELGTWLMDNWINKKRWMGFIANEQVWSDLIWNEILKLSWNF